MIGQTTYIDTVKDVLNVLEGPLGAQPITGSIVYDEKTNRINLFTVGQDLDGEDFYEKPIVIALTDEGKIGIEKNDTDLDLKKELVKRGVPEEDIIQK
jgi:hypothetical protein